MTESESNDQAQTDQSDQSDQAPAPEQEIPVSAYVVQWKCEIHQNYTQDARYNVGALAVQPVCTEQVGTSLCFKALTPTLTDTERSEA